MSSKIKFVIFSTMIFVSAFIIAILSDDYLGVPFEIDYVCLIFSFIEFVCICTACKVDERSLLCNEHKAVRYKKRLYIITRETKKRIICALVFSLIHYFIIMLIKKISLKDFALAVIFYFLTLAFLITIQFFIEVKINSDAGFFAIIVLYISFVCAGIVVYEYCQSSSDFLSEVLRRLNRLNIVNYASLTRIRLMNCGVKQSVVILFAVDLFTVIVTLYGLRKTDVMKRG